MLIDILHGIVRRRYAAMGFQSRELDSGVGKLHVLLRDPPGSSGTLVLLHGLGTSSSTWHSILPRIQKSIRVAALDLPGFGFSKVRNPEGYCGLQDHVRALEDTLDWLGEGPVILVGHSLGGWVGARCAALHPARVQQLILVDAAGVYFHGVEQLREVFTVRSVADTRRLLNTLWYRYPWYFKPFAHSIHHELMRRQMNKIVESIDASSLLDSELSSLTMPVSAIWGREDRVILPESIDVLRKFIPHMNSYIIDRCGHVPQLERPAEFASILNALIGSAQR